MKYVSIIRRILSIDNALSRLPLHDSYYDTERYDDIEDRLWNKRKELAQLISEYTSCPDRTNKELRRHYYGHKNQVKLACRLLGADFYKVLRGF